MSRKDYTRFSNQRFESKPTEKEESVVEEAAKEESVVEEAAKETPVVGEVLEETPPIEPMNGVVVNCNKLNVRAEPSQDAEVLRMISVYTKVMIDPSASTDDFYNVYLADGSDGFCMKKFIEIE